MSVRPHITTPDLTIQSVDAVVPEGTPASFVITASAAPGADITVNLDSGGTADSNDIVTPPTSVVLPAASHLGDGVGADPAGQRREAEQDPHHVDHLGLGVHRRLTRARPQTTITNNNVPKLTITGGATVSPGGRPR